MTNTPQNKNPDIEASNTAAHRRRFLQVAAGSIALGLAGCSGGNRGDNGGGGSNKIAKSQVNYQDHPMNGDQCSGCMYFVASGYGSNAGKCTKVKGKIANDGWCSLYIEG